jgi:hypothetical protein
MISQGRILMYLVFERYFDLIKLSSFGNVFDFTFLFLNVPGVSIVRFSIFIYSWFLLIGRFNLIFNLIQRTFIKTDSTRSGKYLHKREIASMSVLFSQGVWTGSFSLGYQDQKLFTNWSRL